MKLMTIIRDSLFNKNICILGIDGVGKFSVIEKVNERLNIPIEVQYMGSRDYLTYNMKKMILEKTKILVIV